jgi:hypothetical protein
MICSLSLNRLRKEISCKVNPIIKSLVWMQIPIISKSQKMKVKDSKERMMMAMKMVFLRMMKAI